MSTNPVGTFPNKIGELLVINGYNQRQFADLTGGSIASVSQWVLGRAYPNRFIREKILEVLGEYAGRSLTEEEVWG